jgi:hypothetical protein
MYKEEDCGCSRHEHHGMNREWHHHENCGCGCHENQAGRGTYHYCNCGCGSGSHYGSMHHERDFGSFGRRRFISKEEVIAGLEEYLKQLQAEAKGVEERIAELKKGQE